MTRNPQTSIVRALRKGSTEPEQRLWSALRARRQHFKFRRQVPLCGYVVDFACFERKVVVELDGSQHGTAPNVESEAIRDARLAEAGFQVVRFRNAQVYQELPTVLEQIYARCQSKETPSP